MDINNLYDEAYAAALETLKNQPTYAGNAYDGLKQEAAYNQALIDDNLKKRMNDIGAGQSLTVQNNAQMANLNNLGNIGRQQQAYTDYQNMLNAQTQAAAAAQQAEIYANNYANQSNALINDENNKFNTYYNLYLNNKMTAKQFKALTGIDVKSVSSGSGSSSSNIGLEMDKLVPAASGINTAKVDAYNITDDPLIAAYKGLYFSSPSVKKYYTSAYTPEYIKSKGLPYSKYSIDEIKKMITRK